MLISVVKRNFVELNIGVAKVSVVFLTFSVVKLNIFIQNTFQLNVVILSIVSNYIHSHTQPSVVKLCVTGANVLTP